MTRRPSLLVPGARRVRLISPAGPADPAVVARGKAVLQAAGWSVSGGEVRTPPPDTPYLAGDDARRADELLEALHGTAPIMCVRGGYGTVRTLHHLPPDALPQRLPLVVGMSDITALLVHLVDTREAATLHGPMVVSLPRIDAVSRDRVLGILEGWDRSLGVVGPCAVGRPGTAHGVTTGGNLTVLASLMGTPFEPRLGGRILVIEDVNEPLYKLDRALHQLALHPEARRLAGVVAGSFDGIEGDDVGRLRQLLTDWAAYLGVPLLLDAPVGHGVVNHPIPLGVWCRISSDDGCLEVLDPPWYEPLPPEPRAMVDESVGTVFPVGALLASRRHTPSLEAVAVEPGWWTTTRGAHRAGPAEGSPPIFDVASLTKPLVTATLAMRFVDHGMLELDEQVKALLPGVSWPLPLADVTVEELLAHEGGLTPWRPLFEGLEAEVLAGTLGRADARQRILEAIAATPLEGPPGEVQRYSDLGYIILGAILEDRGGAPLDELFARWIAQPLGLTDSGFLPLATGASSHRVVASERCPRRGLLEGRVNDGNAFSMGGVAGHAGLFSTAGEVAHMARAILASYRGFPYVLGGSPYVATATCRRFLERRSPCPGATYVLGWDTPTPGASSSGRCFSPATVGHLGFTGCSVWIDLAEAVVVVLLTNRVYPDRSNESIRLLRPRLHNAILSTRQSKSAPRASHEG